MHKYIILFLVIFNSVNIGACRKDSLLMSKYIIDSITRSLPGIERKYPNLLEMEEEFQNAKIIQKTDSIVLEELTIANNQVKSLFYNITKFLKKESKISFYVIFTKYDNNLFFEITGDYPNRTVFEFAKKEKSYDLKKYSIYGCLNYKNKNFYIIRSPYPRDAREEDVNIFFKKTGNQVVIKEEKDSLFILENARWTYQFEDGKIILLESVNDKGFFSNP